MSWLYDSKDYKKNKDITLSICYQFKSKCKKKNIAYGGIRTHNLDFLELQFALEKALEKGHLTPELSGPINVKD